MIASKIRDILEKKGVKFRAGKVSDDWYTLPTRNWFTLTFPKALLKFWKKNKLVSYDRKQRRYRWKYVLEANDCDNASGGALWLASVLNFRAKKKDAIAVGEFWYIRDDNGLAHSINFAMLNTRKLCFLEPQQWREVKLTQKEIESCYFYRF